MHGLLHYGLLQDIESSSLCYPVGPCVHPSCIQEFASADPSRSPHLPLATTSLFSMSVNLFRFCKFVHLCHILDATYKGYHMVFVFPCLTYFISRSIPVVRNGIISFCFMAKIPSCICTKSLSIQLLTDM